MNKNKLINEVIKTIKENSGTVRKKQKGSRYIKLICTKKRCEGYTVRITMKHFDNGAPYCPKKHVMQLIL